MHSSSLSSPPHAPHLIPSTHLVPPLPCSCPQCELLLSRSFASQLSAVSYQKELLQLENSVLARGRKGKKENQAKQMEEENIRLSSENHRLHSQVTVLSSDKQEWCASSEALINKIHDIEAQLQAAQNTNREVWTHKWRTTSSGGTSVHTILTVLLIVFRLSYAVNTPVFGVCVLLELIPRYSMIHTLRHW